MTIRLRAHHLLCMLTYVGKGYSGTFTESYDRIAARIAAGEPIEVIDGPDDICAPLLSTDRPHCLNDSVVARDRQALRDVAAVLGREIVAGPPLRLDAAMLALLRDRFSDRTLRAACVGCEWSALCDAIAADGFSQARIRCLP